MRGSGFMDLRQLETFIAISKHKSFSRAGEKLFISQSTVSIQINSLENELGVSLFNREGKGVSLTEAGQLLLERAQSILHLRDTALFELKSSLNRITGNLKLCASNVPCLYVLPEKIKIFRNHYPDIAFDVLQMDSEEVFNSIHEGETELGFVGSIGTDKNLLYKKIIEDDLVLIVPKEKQFGDIIDGCSIEELLKHQFVLRESGSATRKIMETYILEQGYKLSQMKTSATFTSTEGVKEAVRVGLGISVTSIHSIKENEKECFNIVNPKGFPIKREIFLVHHKKRFLSPLAKLFKDFILRNKDFEPNA